MFEIFQGKKSLLNKNKLHEPDAEVKERRAVWEVEL